MIEYRPWGYYRVIDDRYNYKVKCIVVKPGHRLSLQRHERRDELWKIITGKALIELHTDDSSTELRLGSYESVNIKRMVKHRIKNVGSEDLMFIEIQTGDYFGEDDIERFSDDYGRHKKIS